jgi:trans-AT polyketide synthase, acyltransferase and oxidoreductase domains
MSQASGGGMAAVVNREVAEIQAILKERQLGSIDIANYNSPSQTVLSGPRQAIIDAGAVFKELGVTYIPLNVSAPFHSRYMREAEDAIQATLERMTFSELKIPVISNVLARPYKSSELKTNLKRQISSSVQWLDSIRYLMGVGVSEFREIGPGDVLTKLVKAIQKKATPLVVKEEPAPVPAPASESKVAARTGRPFVTPEQLGSAEFRRDYNLRYAYVTGGMVKGIASKELVVRMGKAGSMGFLGTGGLRLPVIEDALQYIQAHLQRGESYGVNLLSNLVNPKAEMEAVDLLLRYGVKNIEAAAYTQLTPALVKFRLKGLSRDKQGNVTSQHRVMAKISRPEVAELFLNPPAERLVKQLVDSGAVSREQAELSQKIAMADDLCVEADSGGHTDMGIVTVLLPTIMRQRDTICRQRGYSRRVRVGTAGGIGSPEAAASAFILGAEFILTGSINQCTVEAGTSDEVKDMLADMNVQDTDYAPAGDMFEIGARVQVLSRGVLFPPRANKLHELWRNHGAWEQIDPKTRQQIEGKYFGRSFGEVFEETRNYYLREMPQQIDKAEVNPKHKMALVFRWYFVHTMRLAMKGDKNDRVNYQVHTGPAMGAFNQWVKGTGLENWRNRHPDALGELLMKETAGLLCERLGEYTRVLS